MIVSYNFYIIIIIYLVLIRICLIFWLVTDIDEKIE